MIVNLIGLPASGKSTFARWFISKHPNTLYLPIDIVRGFFDANMSSDTDVLDQEIASWEFIRAQIADQEPPIPRFVILESTGLSPGIERIWEDNKIVRPVYTIKFIVPLDVLTKRAHHRAKLEGRSSIAAEDDECAILLEEAPFSLLPSNLVVRADDKIELLYKEVEEKILAAELHHMMHNLRPTQEELWK